MMVLCIQLESSTVRISFHVTSETFIHCIERSRAQGQHKKTESKCREEGNLEPQRVCDRHTAVEFRGRATAALVVSLLVTPAARAPPPLTSTVSLLLSASVCGSVCCPSAVL